MLESHRAFRHATFRLMSTAPLSVRLLTVRVSFATLWQHLWWQPPSFFLGGTRILQYSICTRFPESCAAINKKSEHVVRDCSSVPLHSTTRLCSACSLGGARTLYQPCISADISISSLLESLPAFPAPTTASEHGRRNTSSL